MSVSVVASVRRGRGPDPSEVSSDTGAFGLGARWEEVKLAAIKEQRKGRKEQILMQKKKSNKGKKGNGGGVFLLHTPSPTSA